jgi:hypothetical protein
MRRTVPELGFELIESCGGADGVDEDAAIVLIAGVSGEPQRVGVLLHKKAIAYALHTPTHRELPGDRRAGTFQSGSPAAMACAFSSIEATFSVS